MCNVEVDDTIDLEAVSIYSDWLVVFIFLCSLVSFLTTSSGGRNCKLGSVKGKQTFEDTRLAPYQK